MNKPNIVKSTTNGHTAASRRRWRNFACVIALCAAMHPAVSHAIIGGEPDGDAHPNVGALILKFEDFSPIPLPGVPVNTFPVCSGSLVARDGNRGLYLTAGHCIDALRALAGVFAEFNPLPAVSFSSNLHDDPGVPIPVRMNALYGEFSGFPPGFDESGNIGVLRDAVDIGLLVLEAADAADLPVPLSLPSTALLESIGSYVFHTSEFRGVGYGDDLLPAPPTRAFVFGVREIAYPRPVNLTEPWLVTQQNEPSGSSGFFRGDSGCPIFWVNPATGQETLVAIAVGPVGTEAGVNPMAQGFRIDSAHALDFIADVMAAEAF